MNRDDQLMPEQNVVVEGMSQITLSEVEAAIMSSAADAIGEVMGNDYHEPRVINDFVIESFNSFGQVTSKSLPTPTPEMRGDYVTVGALLDDENGGEVAATIKIICSGVAWYLVPPALDADYVLLAAREIEAIQSYVPETDE